MRSININTALLGPIVVVRETERDETGTPRISFTVRSTGEAVYYSAAMVPSLRGPVEVRLSTNRPVTDLGPVEIIGEARLGSHYRARRGARDAQTHITLTCSEVRPTTQAPDLIGRDVPVVAPDEVMFLARGERACTVSVPGLRDVDGTSFEVEIVGDGVDPAVTAGQRCRLVGLTARPTVVDREDVGQYAKARLRFFADRLEPIRELVGAGARRRPTPEPDPATPAE